MIPKRLSSPVPAGDVNLPIPPEKIEQHLQQIMDSDEFHATESQRKLLEYVVRKTIAGESDQIKGYTIATRLFCRKEDFDQNYDPIVSIHANKLRRALERYYFTAGIHDQMRIEIPKGGYVPIFNIIKPTADTEQHRAQSTTPTIPNESLWPTLLIQSFQSLDQRKDEISLSIGLSTELAVELTKYKDIRVILDNPVRYGKRASDMGVRFTVAGTLRCDGKKVRLSVYLYDAINCMELWGESYQFEFEAETISEIEKQTAQNIAAKIAGEYGIIAQAVLVESKINPPTQLKTYEAILLYYEYDRLQTHESFTAAKRALENAAIDDPYCGQVWSLLGRLYGNIYGLEMPGFETALENAVSYAEKGIHLNPGCQKSRVILAYVHMLCNELSASLAGLNQAMALNPGSLLILDGIGYMYTLLGEWEHGTTIIEQITQVNPYYSPIVHHALWVNDIRQKNYDQAYLQTLHFSMASLFWEPLMKASVLGHLGRIEEAKKAAQQLIELKPDFQARGRILVGHYIKFDDIAERVVSGLCKAGMAVD